MVGDDRSLGEDGRESARRTSVVEHDRSMGEEVSFGEDESFGDESVRNMFTVEEDDRSMGVDCILGDKSAMALWFLLAGSILAGGVDHPGCAIGCCTKASCKAWELGEQCVQNR